MTTYYLSNLVVVIIAGFCGVIAIFYLVYETLYVTGTKTPTNVDPSAHGANPTDAKSHYEAYNSIQSSLVEMRIKDKRQYWFAIANADQRAQVAEAKLKVALEELASERLTRLQITQTEENSLLEPLPRREELEPLNTLKRYR